MLCTRRGFIAIAAASAVAGCEDLPESSFELPPDSRLPVWFSLPSGASRSDVSVKMTYYTRNSRREAVFELFKNRSFLPGRHRVQKVLGILRGMEPIHLSGSNRPTYEVVTVDGQIDIVEHRGMEPIFYMVEDEEVFLQLGVSPNKSLQRSANHKVLGRGRVVSAPMRAPRARVLTSQPAAAELSR